MNISSAIKGVCLTGAFLLPIASTSAQAADGCKFLLCMGAVNPMGISECAGTVKEVLRDLSKGKSLPTCNLSNGADSKTTGNYVNYSSASHIPPCPSGTQYGLDNVYYHRGGATGSGGYKSNIDEGRSLHSRGTKYQSRVCVGGKKLKAFTTKKRVDGSIVNERHESWEKVETVAPDNAKYDFRMFVDGKPYSNHRF